MIINPITIDKIVKSVELLCPIIKDNLVTEVLIVGSVAKGTAKKDSDIDIYLINPLFESQDITHSIDLPFNVKDIYIKEITNKLKELNASPEFIDAPDFTTQLCVWSYKDELFHFMYDYNLESIKKGVYIEITEKLCDEINENDK